MFSFWHFVKLQDGDVIVRFEASEELVLNVLNVLNVDNHLLVNVGVAHDIAKLLKVDFSVLVLENTICLKIHFLSSI